MLKAHKYSVGQTVRYTSGPFGRFGASGSFKVIKLLPLEGDEHQYRIKSAGEAFERVAKESQLDRDRSVAATARCGPRGSIQRP